MVILTSVCGFLLSPSEHTWLVPHMHSWTCPFTSFPVHFSATLSHVTVSVLKLWKTLLNKLYANVITDLLVVL